MGKQIIYLIAFSLLFVYIFCEVLIYYVYIAMCSWPVVAHNDNTIRAFILSDTHLLGPKRGHWFDKLRREWQMHRAFQSASTLHQPNAVFILGDVFDEGQWSNSQEFAIYLARFERLFASPPGVEFFVVPGNHDVGFHYVATPRLLHQFHTSFNISAVYLKTFKGSHFVLLNSMAFEGDDCHLCASADKELTNLSKALKCENGGKCLEGRPIVLQHFPMYRKSDESCNEPDEAPMETKGEFFREKWDCLSKEASERIYNLLRPRAIFTGHTHHGCHVIHRGDIHEYTIPSFSWRNKNDPTFTMAVITPDEYKLTKCFMPEESTVILIYFCTGTIACLTLTFIYVFNPMYSKINQWWSFYKYKYS